MDKKNVTPIVPKSTTAPSNKADEAQLPKKSVRREIGELAFIALILVPLINLFVLQSYAIPTPSMESSLLVGDKLFVSKLHYGPRLPQTPLALPYVHNQIFGLPSYIETLSLSYNRLPGLSSINRGDVVVFNYPGEYVQKIPVDKRTNYVKRCVAQAGDTLQIVHGEVLIDSQPAKIDKAELQHLYGIQTKDGSRLSLRKIKKNGFSPDELATYQQHNVMFLTDELAQELQQRPDIAVVQRIDQPEGVFNSEIYPHDSSAVKWNLDNFGPLYLPKVGDKIKLDSINYALYQLPIREYENNPSLTWKDGKANLNGQPIEEYEFKMNYYFMMGDNRNNSQDSRFWGFVPEDHIVGKPVFVWLSTDPNTDSWGSWVRWAKSFRLIH